MAGIRFAFTLYAIRKDFLQYRENPRTQPWLGVDPESVTSPL